MQVTDILFRLVLAAVLGGIIGIERDRHGRSAGLRTQLLVSLGAALFMLLSTALVYSEDGFIGDPSRIAAQIVTGIGFLGAGAIIKSGYTIRGLTTAASMWVSAGIGMAAGGGYYAEALLVTGMVMATLLLLRPITNIMMHDSYRTLTVTLTGSQDPARVTAALQEDPNVTVLYCDIDRDYAAKFTRIRLSLQLLHKGETDRYAQSVIDTIEKLKLPLKDLKWDHHE